MAEGLATFGRRSGDREARDPVGTLMKIFALTSTLIGTTAFIINRNNKIDDTARTAQIATETNLRQDSVLTRHDKSLEVATLLLCMNQRRVDPTALPRACDDVLSQYSVRSR